MKLMLRKVQYAPESEGMAPSVETTRDFVMSDKPLHVRASLDKEVGVVSQTEAPASVTVCVTAPCLSDSRFTTMVKQSTFTSA